MVLIMIFPVFILTILISVLPPSLCGRTTNKYTSLTGGGFHHHGGFLAGYFNFFRGSRDNPADSFSHRYEEVAQDNIKGQLNHTNIDYTDFLTDFGY